MKNFLEALYKTIFSVAIDIITILVILIFFSLVWETNKVFAIIVYLLFAAQVYMEYDKIKGDN